MAMKQECSKMDIDRREILMLGLAGASALVFGKGSSVLAAEEKGVGRKVFEPFCLDPDSLEGLGGPDVQIVALAAQFSDQAIADAIADVDQEVINARIDEGAALFSLAQGRVKELGFEIRLGNVDVDLNIPALTSEVVFANFEANLLTLGADDKNKLVAAVLAALGIDGVADAILAVLNEAPGAPSLSFMTELFKAKKWKELRAELGKLFKYLTTKDFFRRLGKKIGEKAAKGIIAKIVGRAIPIIGWVIVIGTIIYTLIKC